MAVAGFIPVCRCSHLPAFCFVFFRVVLDAVSVLTEERVNVLETMLSMMNQTLVQARTAAMTAPVPVSAPTSVAEALEIFAADRTGLVDFASMGAGGAVLHHSGTWIPSAERSGFMEFLSSVLYRDRYSSANEVIRVRSLLHIVLFVFYSILFVLLIAWSVVILFCFPDLHMFSPV